VVSGGEKSVSLSGVVLVRIAELSAASVRRQSQSPP
jgi:hypothetical protein